MNLTQRTKNQIMSEIGSLIDEVVFKKGYDAAMAQRDCIDKMQYIKGIEVGEKRSRQKTLLSVIRYLKNFYSSEEISDGLIKVSSEEGAENGGNN